MVRIRPGEPLHTELSFATPSVTPSAWSSVTPLGCIGARRLPAKERGGPAWSAPMNFPARRCELPAAPIVSAIIIAKRSRRRGRRRSRSRLLVCRSRNAHRNGSDSQCKNECNFAHHHTLPRLLMGGYMADFQSSVCDISATEFGLSSSTARQISAAFRRCLR